MSELREINYQLLQALKLMILNATVFGCEASHMEQAKAAKKRAEYYNQVEEAEKFMREKSEDLLYEAQMEGGAHAGY